MKYRFRPRLIPTLIMFSLVTAFIKLGLWQYHKAEAKQALQRQLLARHTEPPVGLPTTLDHPENWRYRRVRLHGTYDAHHQILLDNQVYQGVAGYHVLTPFEITETHTWVLVNRGWVAAPADHSRIPDVAVPAGSQVLAGDIWLPGKYFSLGDSPTGQWQPVWQYIDLAQMNQTLPYQVLPAVVRLSPEPSKEGLIREWPEPAERLEKNLSYAYQWFGFAATALLVYLFTAFRKGEA